MGTIVVDASVAIAFRNQDDANYPPVDRAITQAYEEGVRLVLPASAYAESLVGPLAAGIVEKDAIRDLVRVFAVEPLSAEIGLEAARLRATTKLRLPDALVVATGVHLDADQILTCDKAWKGVDKRVRVLAAKPRPG